MNKTYKSKESYQRAMDALARGALTTKDKAIERRKVYQKNPSLCIQCNKPLDFKKRKNKFCSRSCSATFNNIRSKIDVFCLNCGGTIEKHGKKYCSLDCFHIFQNKIAKTQALEDLKNGTLNDENARNWFRKLFEHKCAICGLSEWRGEEIPLAVDHIDGNYSNNLLDNLRMVCCNCDAQLSTYKGKNKGNGRINRK